MTGITSTTGAAHLPPVASAQARLLLPFLFERRAADRAAEALANASAGLARGVWVREAPRKLYRYRLEMTGHLDRFLFSHGEKGKVEGEYLRAGGDRIRRWLGALDVHLGDRTARVTLAATAGVELFLTAHGAGVLSITFDHGRDLEAGAVLDLNRRLSILTRPGERAPWLSAARPGGDPAAAETSPPASRPLGDRLESPGALFSLAELAAALLEPIRGMGLAPIQESLCVYSVVAMPPGVHLEDEAAQAWVGRVVAALAEVQAGLRPLAPRGDPGPPSLLVGHDHWTAASLQGAAHLVAADAGPGTADEAAAEVRDRWFVPYLTALLQRCAIKKAAEEATEMVVQDDVKREAVSRLRSDVLSFALAGALPEVSVRYALHRYYRMCQGAMDFDRNLEQVRSALGDLEAQLSGRQQMQIAEAQRDLARQAAESQESSHRIHVALVWIEVFIVVAYAAELVRFVVIEMPHVRDPSLRWVAGFLVVGVGAVALAILRPWAHRHGKRGTHGKDG